MELERRISAFVQLGQHLSQLSPEAFDSLTDITRQENPWFTPENIRLSIKGICHYLDEESLLKWTTSYNLNPSAPKTIGVVMAGNIPLVGFHDLLSVLISGHAIQLKISSKDSKLINYVIKQLVWLEPEFKSRITIKEQLKGFDAAIATGSDNTARYFHYYFGKYPNIIRKNRTSCAILTGKESKSDFEKLGDDLFMYFGLGCRNVSKLYVPQGYSFIPLLGAWNKYAGVIHHHKYCNNYDYQKSILLVNRIPFLDNGFVLLQESEKVVSPISVIYYEYYTSKTQLETKLKESSEKLQCIVGESNLANVPFGKAQYPEVWDYADQIDTLKFLSSLS
jgi:hypothetical protein